jgi:hypothetical protein
MFEGKFAKQFTHRKQQKRKIREVEHRCTAAVMQKKVMLSATKKKNFSSC